MRSPSEMMQHTACYRKQGFECRRELAVDDTDRTTVDKSNVTSEIDNNNHPPSSKKNLSKPKPRIFSGTQYGRIVVLSQPFPGKAEVREAKKLLVEHCRRFAESLGKVPRGFSWHFEPFYEVYDPETGEKGPACAVLGWKAWMEDE